MFVEKHGTENLNFKNVNDKYVTYKSEKYPL